MPHCITLLLHAYTIHINFTVPEGGILISEKNPWSAKMSFRINQYYFPRCMVL